MFAESRKITHEKTKITNRRKMRGGENNSLQCGVEFEFDSFESCFDFFNILRCDFDVTIAVI